MQVNLRVCTKMQLRWLLIVRHQMSHHQMNKTLLCTFISHFLYIPVVLFLFVFFVDIIQEREGC